MLPLSDGVPPGDFRSSVLLIAANFAVWLLYTAELTGDLPRLVLPVHHRRALPLAEPWGLSWITAFPLHGGWDHILGNMLFLATRQERRGCVSGRFRDLIFYFVRRFRGHADPEQRKKKG